MMVGFGYGKSSQFCGGGQITGLYSSAAKYPDFFFMERAHDTAAVQMFKARVFGALQPPAVGLEYLLEITLRSLPE